MAVRLKTLPGEGKVALRWSRDVDHLGSCGLQHFAEVGETLGNTETFAQLFGHQQFAVTERHDFAIGHAVNGQDVLVGNFAATDDGNTQGIHFNHGLTEHAEKKEA